MIKVGAIFLDFKYNRKSYQYLLLLYIILFKVVKIYIILKVNRLNLIYRKNQSYDRLKCICKICCCLKILIFTIILCTWHK